MFNYLINDVDVEKVVLLGEQSIAVDVDANSLDLDDINEKFGKYLAETDEFIIDALEEFFREYYGLDVAVETAEYYGDTDEDRLIYDRESKIFYNQRDGHVVEIYRYWDGSNWQTVELGDDLIDVVVVVDQDYVNLDEWNGHDWVTGGTGLHERVYRIAELDEEKPSEPTFLLEKWSQWQGEEPKGYIMTLSEVVEHLKELGRDVDEYVIALDDGNF
jgi:hypothetical protein